MTDHWAGIAGIIVAIQGVLALLLAPYIKARIESKHKVLELELQRREKEIDRHFADQERRRREHSKKKHEITAHLYSYLWNLTINQHADRVYIIQPHPVPDKQYISVSFEVVRDGISQQRNHFQFHKSSYWTEVIDLWKKNDFLKFHFENNGLQQNEKPVVKKIWTEAMRRGCISVAFYRLLDVNNSWIGVLAVEHLIDRQQIHTANYRNDIATYGELVADILPEYEPSDMFNTEIS